MAAGRQPVAVIAAAGRAKRFAGQQKVLADMGGRPAICRVAEACNAAFGPHRQVVVVGHHGDRVRAALGEAPHRQYVTQEAPLGTGHALATALARLDPMPDREVYFLCGDKPLLSSQSLRYLEGELGATGAAMAFLTGAFTEDPAGNRQGRVLQVHSGTPRAEVLGIVERATIDALGESGSLSFTSQTGESYRYGREELLATREVNLSGYVWREGLLREHLGALPLHPEKGEYFVTDLVEVLRRHGLLVRAVRVHDSLEGLGIDTLQQLAVVREAWQALQPTRLPVSRPDRAARAPSDEGEHGACW